MKEDIIICECGDLKHHIIIKHDYHFKSVWLNINSSSNSFWQRLKFLFTNKYCYTEIVISKDDTEKLQEIINTLNRQ